MSPSRLGSQNLFVEKKTAGCNFKVLFNIIVDMKIHIQLSVGYRQTTVGETAVCEDSAILM